MQPIKKNQTNTADQTLNGAELKKRFELMKKISKNKEKILEVKYIDL